MLLPFLIVSFFRFFLKIKGQPVSFPRFPKISRDKLLAILIIIIVGFCLRLPYLINYLGMLTSDDVIYALEGKHISEGKVPPICCYGQLYLGTLPSHFFALVFKTFGYSIFNFKLFTFLLYLGFVIFHFLFLTKFSSLTFALCLALFYFLPLGYLVHISLDGMFIFPLILILGLLIIYISYVVAHEKKPKYLSCLGFLIGLSFWTHPMTIYFIVIGIFLLFLNYKFDLKKYLTLFLYAVIGYFPQLLLDIFNKFYLVGFLEAGKGTISWDKIKKTIDLSLYLLSLSEHPARVIFVFVILFGFLAILYYSFKTKQYDLAKIYNSYLIVFFLVYLFSGHSDRYFIRYLFPLIFCLPICLLSWALLIKSKIKYLAVFIFCLFCFLFFNLKEQYSFYLAVKEYHGNLKKIANFLQASKVKYWKGDFWTSYLLTAITGEKVIIGSTTLRRYYPYELLYENYANQENFIFLRGEGSLERRQARDLLSLLEALKIPYKKKEIGDCWLIYDINSAIKNIIPGPPLLPKLSQPEIEVKGGYLLLSFRNLTKSDQELYFWINVEIKEFSLVSKPFSLKDSEIKIEIPYPPKDSLTIIYYLDYQGVAIPSSYQQIQFTRESIRLEELIRPEIVYLFGIGSSVNYEGQSLWICQKKVKIEWNRPLENGEQLNLVLHSPFKFYQLYWYGQYVQEVEIRVNDQLVSKAKLKDGRNIIKIGSKDISWREKNNLISLNFKYHFRFGFSPRWKTSALLEKIFVEKKSF
ncbi:MAG: hypothetical protein N3B16_06285 [Candidatus Aminicenantes bacterium]|nr:hypothetical protein [Candidatus Aminicenantes bacterium]